MNSTMSASLEQALADGASLAVVLDLVDEAIEQASAAGDADTLDRLSRRLEAVATERGGEWKALAIAGIRAGALAALTAPSRTVTAEPSFPLPATPIAPVATSQPAGAFAATERTEVAAETTAAYAGWWIRAFAYLIDLIVLGAAWAFPPPGSGRRPA